MISWMQKHNKFLIVTIWIATISFIFTGATYGFSFGLKSNNLGEVGSINLSKDRFQMEYQNLYSQYNQMFQEKFDEEQAKAMRLQEQVLNKMIAQAKILNLAKDFGIIVSDEEVAIRIATIPAFQNNGKFDKNIYQKFLQNSRIGIKTFESSLRDELTIQKTFALISNKGLENEYKAFQTALEVADKLKYLILSPKDVNLSIDDEKLKAYWEIRKDQFKTPKQYTLDLVWYETKDINVTDEEIKAFYQKNSFKYTDNEDKRLSLDEAKDQVVQDLKVQKAKRGADKTYIAYKKEKIEKSETLTYDLNDLRLPPAVWQAIESKKAGDLLKPKVVNDRYAIIKIVQIVNPTIKSFDAAKSELLPLYKSELIQEELLKLAQSKLSNIEKETTKTSDYLTLKNIEKQKIDLNKQEMANFGSKLFTSNQEKGIIPIGKKVIVYQIVDQKLITIDKNETEGLAQNVDAMKLKTFESNLMRSLDKKYPTKIYK